LDALLGDGEVIGLAVLVSLTVAISIAFVYWVMGSPVLDTRIDIVVIAHSVDWNGSEWRIWLLVGNKGSRSAGIQYILLNDRVCNVNVSVTRGGMVEYYTLPSETIPLEPGEQVEIVFYKSSVGGCNVIVDHGVRLKITLKTSEGRDFFREINVA